MLLHALLPLVLSVPAPAALQSGPQGALPPAASPFFRIQVVDAATQRGVPLVELRTNDGTSYVTDSAGNVAFFEPGLMGREVFFHVSSHGYEYPADFFGFRGLKLTPTRGGQATIAVTRLNLAERLYRITGIGIYRDSRLLGLPTPLARPLINGDVAGQDSALALPFQGRIFWFWGDTGRPSYPLGNFKTSGATSELPGQGGLDPAEGIDLTYWVDANGFSREMAPIPGTGVVWLGGLHSAPDPQGVERMFAHYTRLEGLGTPLEHGLCVWNPNTEVFDQVTSIPLAETLHSKGAAPFAHVDGGTEYLYFPDPYPNLRVERLLASVAQPARFEGYTPLVAGARFDGGNTQLERDPQGKLVWGWKPDTPPLTPSEQRDLVQLGLMARNESPFRLFDYDTGAPLIEHNGTVAWNDFRRKWVMILGVSFAEESFLGEIYYSEAAAPEGPWTAARKIVTHDDYTFYNVAHRSFFDQDGGRLIHFEGTYTRTFSGTEVPTPRYDYNQVMYRLDLSDPRLTQP